MTNTPSLPPGGEKQADQVEAVARAMSKTGIVPMTDALILARAALSASKPLLVEECARVADATREEIKRLHASDWKHVKIGSLVATCDTIARAIRALKESPSEGSGG